MAALPENDRIAGPFIALAGQTDFPADFPLLNPTAVRARLLRAGAAVELTPPLVAAVELSSEGFTGRLDYDVLAGDLVWIYSELPAARPRQHTPNGAVRSATLEADAEAFQAQLQEHRAKLGRSIVLPVGVVGGVAPWAPGMGERFLTIGADGVPRVQTRPDDFDALGKLNRTANNLDGEDEAQALRENIGLRRATPAEARDEAVDTLSMTPKAAFGAMRVLVEHINIRETRFAGGAKINGIDDDAPAFRAALAYTKTLGGNIYDGGRVKLKVPCGVVRQDSADPARPGRVLNITGAHNVMIEGEGDGATTLRGTQNLTAMKGDDTLANPLFRFGLKDMTLYGPGYTNTNAHGIDLGPNNNCLFKDFRIWAHRRAVTFENSFHTEYFNMRLNGTGGLANYDGMYGRDGDAGVVENAIGIYGGRIYGCVRYGWRGESVTGSFVSGLEVLGCGLIGVYFGDSPSGKPLKWFSWSGGLIDTCPDLMVVKKGVSTEAELLHWSGMWMGYASEGPPGLGVGVEMNGIKHSKFDADLMVNMSTMVQLDACDSVRVNVGPVKDYDRTLVGAPAILLQSSSGCRIDIGSTRKAAGSPTAYPYIENGTSNYNLVTGVFDNPVATLGAQSNKVGVIVRP